jgi:hemerythrin
MAMRAIKWSGSHAVHIPEIDAEHRAVYQSAGDLQQAVEAGAPQDRILEMLHGLAATVEDHFTHEERLMRSACYLSYNWHRQQHDAARRRLAQFIGQIEAGVPESAVLLVEYLSGWLRDHIGVSDRMMGAHLRNYSRSHAA